MGSVTPKSADLTTVLFQILNPLVNHSSFQGDSLALPANAVWQCHYKPHSSEQASALLFCIPICFLPISPQLEPKKEESASLPYSLNPDLCLLRSVQSGAPSTHLLTMNLQCVKKQNWAILKEFSISLSGWTGTPIYLFQESKCKSHWH